MTESKTLPKLPGLLSGSPGSAAGRRVVLLHQGAGATIDHFLRGPLEAGGADLQEVNSAVPADAATLRELDQADLVVVVRYLPRPWLAQLRALRRGGTELALLLDDDLLDPAALAELPKEYRRRIRERITCRRHQLPGLFARVWVTSAELALRYAHLEPMQLPLRPASALLTARPRLQLAYLGTASHVAEFRWLLPLLETLQSRQPHTHVELFGDLAVNRAFRHLPRVRILHPMGWSNYLAETGAGRVDLLLVPLLEGRFNTARAPVKLIDAARCGAAALFSDRVPYRGFIQHGSDGLLLGDAMEDWLEAIEHLIADPGARQRLAEGARERALALCPGRIP
jgi:hypothetical protein